MGPKVIKLLAFDTLLKAIIDIFIDIYARLAQNEKDSHTFLKYASHVESL